MQGLEHCKISTSSALSVALLSSLINVITISQFCHLKQRNCDIFSQVSAAVNPANESTASFRECVIIKHPRHGEFAFGFITGSTSAGGEESTFR